MTKDAGIFKDPRDAWAIVLAIQRGGSGCLRKFSRVDDESVVPKSPELFYAVAQLYERRHDVSDREARALLRTPR